MDGLLRAIETSGFSVWTRESTSVLAYPAFLSAHAIGMGLVVGVTFAVALHVLGWLPGPHGHGLRRLVPLVWVGGLLNGASGLLLLVAYPTKALTNPVFHLKLLCVAAGTFLYVRMHRRLQDDDRVPGAGFNRGWRLTATAALVSWAVAITAGRLLAYTYRRLFVDF